MHCPDCNSQMHLAKLEGIVESWFCEECRETFETINGTEFIYGDDEASTLWAIYMGLPVDNVDTFNQWEQLPIDEALKWKRVSTYVENLNRWASGDRS